MPGTAASTAHLARVKFGTTGWTGSLKDFSVTGVSRAAHNTSHLGLTAASTNQFGNMTYLLSSLVDGGELSMRVLFNVGQSGVTAQPPIGASAETITIYMPKASGDSTSATWAFSGGCTGYDATFPEDGVVEQDIRVKVLGTVSVTAAT